jgi:ApaG protein
MESEAITRGVRVRVHPEFDAKNSLPDQGRWFFRYTVTIENEGDETVQLLTRHWIITDGEGKTEQVRGPGVVGHQPTLDPGQAFSYTSGCPLTTSFGLMHGSFQMVTANGVSFDAEIAPFELTEQPYMVN